MPFDLFDKYCKEEGFCCPLALLTARQNWQTWAIAEDAGIAERTAREWRDKFRKHKLTCPRAANCMLAKATGTAP
jgi:hypothetical protein